MSVYALTDDAEKAPTDQESFEQADGEIPNQSMTIILGHFNAKMGREEITLHRRIQPT